MKQGDIVFDVDGNEYEFEQKTIAGFLVYRAYEECDDYGPFTDDRPVILDKVFSEPPTQRYHKEIESLRRERDALEKGLDDKRAETRRALEEYNAAFAKFSKLEALRTLEACIDGRITHIVTYARWDGPEIIEISDEKERDANYTYYPVSFKLLSLFGRSRGNLKWGINEYKDGSGSWYSAFPCTSLEMAQEMAQKLHREKMLESEPCRNYIDIARKLGVEIPPEYTEAVESKEREEAQAAVDEARQKLAKRQAELDALAAAN